MKNKWTKQVRFSLLSIFILLIINDLSAQINIDFAVTSPTCNGYTNGTITANPTGGTAPYQYFWSTGQAGQTTFNVTGGNYAVTVSDAMGMTATDMTTVSQPDLLEVSVGTDGDVCLGTDGTWSATVSGGTPIAIGAYFYQWSNGTIMSTVSNLSPGFLSVTVTDANGCKAINGRTVNLPLSVEMVTTDVVCFGLCDASANLTITGGVGPFTYLWNTGSTDPSLPMIAAGDFSVTVTDSDGCTAVANGTVNEPPAIILDATITGQCTNIASISVTATGGTPPLQYDWNTGATSPNLTNLSAGTYSLTVTDANNCKVDTAFVISVGDIEVNITDIINPTCLNGNDGTLAATVSSGTAPFTYLWSNGGMTSMITGLQAGTYTITVTDAAGCTDTDSATLVLPPDLILELSSTPADCDGMNGTATVDNVINGVAPFTYAWNINPQQTTQTAINLAAGVYEVTVTDDNGCTAIGNATVGLTTNLELELSSTPADCDGTNGTATVDNVINGVAPFTYAWNTNPVQTTQTATNLAAGVYEVTVTDNNGCTAIGNVTVGLTTNIELELSSTPADCDGTNGTATVDNVIGGEAPFTYAWNTNPIQNTQTATNLAAGVYEVTVTDDNDCTAVGNVTVGLATNIELELSSTPADCDVPNGTATVDNVIGGVSPFTYIWNTNPQQTTQTATNLAAGIYEVTVTDDNGCTTVGNVTVGLATNIELELSSTPADCDVPNGTATVDNVIGGVAPFTYAWNTNPIQNTQTATNLATGNYEVTVTDDNGCTAVGNVTVGLTTNLELELSSTPADCDAANGTATVDNVIGGVSPFTYVWNTNPVQNTQTATGLAADNYEVTVTDDNGCTAIGNVTVGLTTNLELELSSTPADCDGTGGTVTVDNVINGVAPFMYAWDTSPVQTTQTATNLAAGIYEVTVTDNNGCTAIGNVEVYGSDPLTILLQIENASCQNSSDGQITIVQVGPVFEPPLTYTWSHDIDLNNAVASDLPVGIYGVTVTDDAGCTGSADNLLVEANSTIDADIIWEVDTCMGDSILVTFSESTILTPANSTIISWDWVFDNGTTSSDPTVQFYTTSDSIMATLIVENSANCMDTVSELIVFNLLCDLYPDTIFICENEELTLMPDANCTGITTYNWESNPAIIAGGNTATPTILTDESVILMVDLTNNLGCGLMETVFIEVVDTSKQITADEIMTTQCDSTTVDFSIDNPDIACYDWIFDYPNFANTGSGQSPSYTYPTPGIYTLAIAPNQPCLDTVFIEILVSEPPSADFMVNVAPCTETVDISLMDASLTPTNITNWHWTLSNGDTSDLQNPTFTFDSCQIIDAMLIIDFAAECQDTAMMSFEVSVFSNPPNLPDTIVVCAVGDTIFLNPNGNPGFDYVWSPANLLDDPNAVNPMYIVEESTEFSVLISDDACGDTCSVEQDILVILSDEINLEIPENISVCEDTEVDLTATSATSVTFSWATNADFNPVLDSIGVLMSSDLNFTITDTTTMFVRAIDEFGCVQIDSFLLANYEIQAEPQGFTNVCVGDSLVTIPINNLSAADTITWLPDNPNGTLPTASGVYTLQIVNNNGCTLEQDVEVNVQDITNTLNVIPQIDTILLGDEVRITALSENNWDYNWTPGGSLDDPAIANPTATPTESTTYQLEVFDEDTECRGMGSSQICVVNNICGDPLIFVPNTFTPNGDGLNDIFYVRGFNIDEVQMVVYNRWGQKVFETQQVDKGWDGSYEGGVAPSDVYGYYLKVRCIEGGEYERKGNVTVIR